MLPVEDGGGDAVWSWSSTALDLHEKRTRMDIKEKMNRFTRLLLEVWTLSGLFE